MTWSSNAIVVACGIATFLLRFLPIWRTRRKPASSKPAPLLDRFLQAIGPAAISALIVISLHPKLIGHFQWPSLIAIALALLTIVLSKRATSGIAVPTLAGALVYGLTMHGLGS